MNHWSWVNENHFANNENIAALVFQIEQELFACKSKWLLDQNFNFCIPMSERWTQWMGSGTGGAIQDEFKKTEAAVLKGSWMFSKENKLKMDQRLYCKMYLHYTNAVAINVPFSAFQGIGSDKQNDCYEQHKTIPVILFEWKSRMVLARELREFIKGNL